MHLLFLFDLELSFLSLHSKVPRESARLKTFTPCYRELGRRTKHSAVVRIALLLITHRSLHPVSRLCRCQNHQSAELNAEC